MAAYRAGFESVEKATANGGAGRQITVHADARRLGSVAYAVRPAEILGTLRDGKQTSRVMYRYGTQP